MKLDDLSPAERRQIKAGNLSARAASHGSALSITAESPATKRGKARAGTRRTPGGSPRGEFKCARCPFEGDSWVAMQRHADDNNHPRIILRLETR